MFLGVNILSNGLANNGIVANFFYLSAIYVFLNRRHYIFKNRSFKYIIVGILIGIGTILRSLGPVYLLAMIIYISLHQAIKSKHYKKAMMSITKLILSYVVIVLLYSQLVIFAGMTQQTHFQNPMISTWKVLVGTDVNSNGHIGDEERALFNKLRHEWNDDYNKFNVEAKKIIKERIYGNPLGMTKLIGTKFHEFWGQQDSTVNWVTKGDTANQVYYYFLNGRALTKVFHYQLIIIYILGVISSIYMYYRHRHNEKILLPIIILVGYTLAYSLYEIQTRYRYSVYFILIMLASYGMVILLGYLKKLRTYVLHTLFKSNEQKRTISKKLSYLGFILLIIMVIKIGQYEMQHKNPVQDLIYHEIDGQYIFKPLTRDENNSYAWYIYKDGSLVEKIMYDEGPDTLIKTDFEPGVYVVKVFVRDLNTGYTVSTNSEEFYVE